MHWRYSQSKVRYLIFLLTNVADVLVAEFRESIKPAIPQIIALLGYIENDRRVGVYALSKLSDYGEISYSMTAMMLMYL